MNQPYVHVNAPYLTLTRARRVFEVQLYKNNARALLSLILSIVNPDWLQNARSVRGLYECISNILDPSPYKSTVKIFSMPLLLSWFCFITMKSYTFMISLLWGVYKQFVGVGWKYYIFSKGRKFITQDKQIKFVCLHVSFCFVLSCLLFFCRDDQINLLAFLFAKHPENTQHTCTGCSYITVYFVDKRGIH